MKKRLHLTELISFFCSPGRCQKSVLLYPGQEPGVVSSRGWLERGSSLSSSLIQGHVLPKPSPQARSWRRTCPLDFARNDTNLTGQNFPVGKILSVLPSAFTHRNDLSLVHSFKCSFGISHSFLHRYFRALFSGDVWDRGSLCSHEAPMFKKEPDPNLVSEAFSSHGAVVQQTAVRNQNVVWWPGATRAPCNVVLRKPPYRT